MKRILVTGGAGFIGSYLVDRLMQTENKVIALDHLSNDAVNNIARWIDHPNFELMKHDLLNAELLDKTIEKCDIVFHLAANADIRMGSSNTKIDYQQNILATYTLLESMRKSHNCKRIIFTSSSTVYGDAKKIPTTEEYSPLAPISLYGATKLACEALISGYCHMFNMSGVVLRLANIVGSRSMHGIIHDFITKLASNPQHLEILGDGNQVKSYLHVNDCIDAMLRIQDLDSVFDIFNVGSKDSIQVKEIAKMMIKELSLSNVELRFKNEIGGRGWKGDVKEMMLDVSKMEELGWSPTHNSREAVNLCIREKVNLINNNRQC
jgi:UDP-glucose 4-epimerase